MAALYLLRAALMDEHRTLNDEIWIVRNLKHCNSPRKTGCRVPSSHQSPCTGKCKSSVSPLFVVADIFIEPESLEVGFHPCFRWMFFMFVLCLLLVLCTVLVTGHSPSSVLNGQSPVWCQNISSPPSMDEESRSGAPCPTILSAVRRMHGSE